VAVCLNERLRRADLYPDRLGRIQQKKRVREVDFTGKLIWRGNQ
jgi:hypothetical protein